MDGKVIIFFAPSGAGKTSIVKHLLRYIPSLSFSVSATSRAPRNGEKHGTDYIFISPEEFHQYIDNGEFLEYEEVYKGCYYGTLKTQTEELLKSGRNIVFDVDVKGACNIKNYYGERALSIFVMPPSVEELRNRLIGRSTDSPEAVKSRIAKAEYELSFADKADRILINDKLEKAQAEALQLVENFIKQ
ncbi:Guanylate kinase [termite gut metagenome]|uniref:Guanylate kinase n=1 Tax=termite gut metagenome TaxID=433724 RepID=A0A5J4SAW6_9ZZZZ